MPDSLRSFLRWLGAEVERAAGRNVGLFVAATLLYLLALLTLFGQAIPRFQGEASAACFRGTSASYCTYPSTRPKCSDLP